MMAVRAALAGLLCLSVAGSAAARTADQRDAEGYAVAACLMQQKSDSLRQQGNAWGSIILERTRLSLDRLRPLLDAVKAETARRPMWQVHGDAPADQTEAPVAYCAEIIDVPAVRAAIGAATASRARSLRRK
jgi:hypothetical protein